MKAMALFAVSTGFLVACVDTRLDDPNPAFAPGASSTANAQEFQETRLTPTERTQLAEGNMASLAIPNATTSPPTTNVLIFGSDGTTYRQIGNTTIGTNGETYRPVANGAISSSGTLYQNIGATTVGSDGSRCRRIANSLVC